MVILRLQDSLITTVTGWTYSTKHLPLTSIFISGPHSVSPAIIQRGMTHWIIEMGTKVKTVSTQRQSERDFGVFWSVIWQDLHWLKLLNKMESKLTITTENKKPRPVLNISSTSSCLSPWHEQGQEDWKHTPTDMAFYLFGTSYIYLNYFAMIPKMLLWKM